VVAVADGFLGRWSQRKQAVREGKPLTEPPAPVPSPEVPAPSAKRMVPAPNLTAITATTPVTPTTDLTAPAPEAAEPAPVLSLDDVKALTQESDYAPFVSRAVSPEVRNAAMKKLFTDPHYNVMDRLDIYIDDYSLPDPLPASMLRQMASAKFLKLFEEEEQAPAPAQTLGDDAHIPTPDSVAQSTSLPANVVKPHLENPPLEVEPDHDHTDLRLQPNDAAGPQEPGRSTQ
jgi:hypothetical protein